MIPVGAEVTAPEPVPVFVTFKTGSAVKFAVAVFVRSIITRQVDAVPEQAPDQPVKVDPEVALAVRVT